LFSVLLGFETKQQADENKLVAYKPPSPATGCAYLYWCVFINPLSNCAQGARQHICLQWLAKFEP